MDGEVVRIAAEAAAKELMESADLEGSPNDVLARAFVFGAMWSIEQITNGVAAGIAQSKADREFGQPHHSHSHADGENEAGRPWHHNIM